MDIKRTITRTSLSAGVAAMAALGLAAGANAKPDPGEPAPQTIHHVGVVNTPDGRALPVRGLPSLGSAAYRYRPDGSNAFITCQTRGSRVTGTYGTSRIWSHLKAGGYVPDVFVYTGSDGRVAPRC